ncbi:hypothetical protein LX16_0743 [Stackebrandtia albiflava]|uniref:Ester cyclase n=1 Tax=Stackebrandtia albiflava TaxID=406432 RepID=A0A562VB00_9ACTN|nr:ester cyclase [Stackebrandtia albiflava]TWJ15045.1 hypothetical protein LX16_0743 [Stackebrandtia albiflava]
MSTENGAARRALYRLFQEAGSSGDLDSIERAVDEAFTPDAVFHTPVPTDVPASVAVKRVWQMLLRAFPDIRVEVQDVIGEGDRMVFRNTVTATHRGEYRGIAPTGRSVEYEEIFIVRLAGDRIAEIWGVVDVYSQLRQLGAIPSP